MTGADAPDVHGLDAHALDVHAPDVRAVELPCQADDGHRWTVLGRVPAEPVAALQWLPALGVAARHYLPFAEALAERGIATFLHEWRGNGSSTLRPGSGPAPAHDWAYRELLTLDLPVTEAAIGEAVPGLDRITGGHSLGGQLACCRLGLNPDNASRLWLVASGSPYWRAFPAPTRWMLPMAYRFLPWLANRRGVLPGRRIGFGGDEARGLISDWARTALSGRYAARGLDVDLDAAMARLAPDVRAVVLADDWLGPMPSLRYLLSKLPRAHAHVSELDGGALGTRADHFAWMKQPEAVVDALLANA